MKVKIKSKKTCDPARCDYCQYVGEGGFLCDEYMEIVVEDWKPTESFRMCMKKCKGEKK